MAFPSINKAYNATFQSGRLSLGLVAPLEHYPDGPVPTMNRHVEGIQLAEKLGFAAVWLRDVSFNVPSFGDAGQLFDPFVYLGVLAAQTNTIALGVASIVLPLRHPAHVAKSAASVDALSGGRLILGVASGDRPDEYPALNIPFEERGSRFRESFEYINRVSESFPAFDNHFGSASGSIDMLPKPTGSKIPMLITGGSQQNPDWIAQNGEGWMTYPRPIQVQAKLINDWRTRIEQAGLQNKPAVQSLYIDLVEEDDSPPQTIHLGFRSGVNYLKAHLRSLQEIGINHVALNLRFNTADIEATLKKLGEEVLPEFPSATNEGLN